MKIKLTNQESRKRIQQLNSRLKILASDIKGQSKYINSNYNLVQSNQSTNRLTKNNYFKSATNLNYNLHLSPQSHYYQLDHQNQTNQQNKTNQQTSPKFAINLSSTQSNFIKQTSPYHQYSPKPQAISSPRSQWIRTDKNVRKQLQQIIQSKKEFHSLIKKELSSLQKLQQVMIEQPQKWNQFEKGYEGRKEQQRYDNYQGKFNKIKAEDNKQMKIKEQGKIIKDKERTKHENKLMGNSTDDMPFKNIQHDIQSRNVQSIKIRERYNVRDERDRELMGTKTDESIHEESRYQQSQHSESARQINNDHYEEENAESVIQRQQNQHQRNTPFGQVQDNNSPQSQIEQNNIQKQQSLSLNRKQVQSLLHQMMIIDYSDQNILSILKLVEQESLRKSKITIDNNPSFNRSNLLENSKQNSVLRDSQLEIKRQIKKEKQKQKLKQKQKQRENMQSQQHSQLSSRVSPNNSSLNYDRPNFTDQIKETSIDQQEQKHYQLIHSYKLFSLILKIKHFSNFNKRLIINSTRRNKTKQATLFRNHKLLTKSVNQLRINCQQSLRQEQMLYKIKSIYVANMLKKNTLQQFVYNSRYKSFKFLANKLKYQRQLSVKSATFSKLVKQKQEMNKYEQLSQLSDSMSKKSLFRMIKERYQKIRQTHSKYIILKNINRHRHWNQLIQLINFNKLKNLVNNNTYTIQQKHSYPLNSDLIQEQNSQQSNSIMEPSVGISQRILLELEKYSKAFCQSHHRHYQDQKEITYNSTEVIVQFTEPIVLHIKKYILSSYLNLKSKKHWMRNFIINFNLQMEKRQRKLNNQSKTQYIKHNLIENPRKHQLINKLELNLSDTKLNKKVQYFCNITIGSVPSHLITFHSIQNHPTITKENNFLPTTFQDSQQDYFQEKHQDIKDNQLCLSLNEKQIKENQIHYNNPLLIKYFKSLFINQFRKFCIGSQRIKLQKQVYFKTIYGTKLLKRYLNAWKTFLKELKIQQKQMQQQRKQQLQQQKRREAIQRQKQSKEQQSKQQLLNQIRQEQQKLKKHQQLIKQQQALLQHKINQLKQKQTELQNLSLEKQQQLKKQTEKQRNQMIKEEQQLKERLINLKKEQQQQTQRLKQIQRNIEKKRIEEEREKEKEKQCKRIKEEEKNNREQDQLREKIKQKTTLYTAKLNGTNLRQRDNQIHINLNSSIYVKEQGEYKLEGLKQDSGEIKNRERQDLIYQRDESRDFYGEYQYVQDELSQQTQIQHSRMNEYSQLSGSALINDNWLTKRSMQSKNHLQQQSHHSQEQNKNQAHVNERQSNLLLRKLHQQSYQQHQQSNQYNEQQSQAHQQQDFNRQTSVIEKRQDESKQSINSSQQQLEQQNNQEQQEASDLESQSSDKILTGYLRNKKSNEQEHDQSQQQKLTSSHHQINCHLQNQPQSQPYQSQQNNEQQLKMNQMMDWLGNKISSQSKSKQQTNIQPNQNLSNLNNIQIINQGNNLTHLETQTKEVHEETQKIDEENTFFFNMLKPNNRQQRHEQQLQEEQVDIDRKETQEDKIQRELHSQQQGDNNSSVEQQIINPHRSVSQHQESQHSLSQSNDQNSQQQRQDSIKQQSDSEPQSSVSQLYSSTSPQHIRLLSYAQNHHSLFIKRLIFSQFKYRSYKKQQNYEFNLLKTVFTQWKLFHQQKLSLKKYLQIYQSITQKINPKQNSTQINQRKTTQSLQKRNYLIDHQYQYQTNRNKPKSQSKPHSQDQPDVKFSKVKYFPTSKKDVQTFQNLYPSNKSEN